MVSATQYLISANTCAFPCHNFPKTLQRLKPNGSLFTIRASSSAEEDCNTEECAPDKEVGKVSMEWLAGEKTKVSGTFPPKKKGWTGYVEKDTAGQTNVYAVEPQVYIAESLISSGTAGTSKDGAENTAAIAAGLALICVAAASSILLQVGKNSPPAVEVYSGPDLSYYINKFTPPQIVEASLPLPPSENAPSVEVEEATIAPESSPALVESETPVETPTSM